LAIFVGCGNNHPPVLQPITDQTAAVGVELVIELRATDADGDTMSFDFDAPGIMDIKSRAQLSTFADGVGRFRWTPQSSDRNVMPYPFDFKVTDGKATTTETVQITVADSPGGTAPVFRQPLGTGTTLDLSMAMCIDVNILVEDSDSTMVTLADEDPKIDGAMLTQTDAFQGTWHWCPSAAQIALQDRWTLHLSADDGTNKTEKTYLIVLRTAQQMNCPGMPPMITHTPLAAQSTVADLAISADITDDIGVKSALLYWTTTMPTDPPDVTTMTPVTMNRTSGDALSGTWEGTIPNPVAGGMAGDKMTVYYLIEAKDNDDATGTCDHVVDSPMKGTYAVDVTNPGGMMRGTGVNCSPCSADIQCATGYECLQIGTAGTFCAAECTGAGTCDANYSCSSSVLTSKDGTMGHYCRATSMTCPPMMVCVEDSLEDNDAYNNIPDPTSANIMSATTSPCAASTNTVTCTNLVVCPRNGGTTDDEDWYVVTLPTDSIVSAEMKIKDYSVGSHADLDLFLSDANMGGLDISNGTGTTEYVSACQPASAMKSLVNVYTFDNPVVASKYDLTVKRIPPDSAEGMDNNNETVSQLGASGASVTQNICGSDDWFWTILTEREALKVDVKFTQRSPNEELNAKLMRDNCASGASPMPVAMGGPVDGGVRIDYHSPDGGADCYYVVVGAPNPNGGNVYTLNSITAP
jgi:hypothetical protein